MRRDATVVVANQSRDTPAKVVFAARLMSKKAATPRLTADPRARVEVGCRRLTVRAEELSVEEAATFWPHVLRVAPDYARYPRRTSRRIPLLRLVRATPTTASGALQVGRASVKERSDSGWLPSVQR
jgi:deazaflavin-dependent oxidoreductase (nitroreductase family)